MAPLPYLLTSKYELFRSHYERLQKDPEPGAASSLFEARLHTARRLQKVRLTFLAGIYFSIVLAVAAVALRAAGLAWVSDMLTPVGGTLSGLAVFFIVGALLAARALSLVDVELYFYAMESLVSRGSGEFTRGLH